MNERIDLFLKSSTFAVAGASTNRQKYGNKVLRAYLQQRLTVHPINPQAEEVEGRRAFREVAELPDGVEALSIVTPPQVTLQVVREALDRGIRHLWMQPGAENDAAIAEAEAAGANVIHGGPCILVALNYRE